MTQMVILGRSIAREMFPGDKNLDYVTHERPTHAHHHLVTLTCIVLYVEAPPPMMRHTHHPDTTRPRNKVNPRAITNVIFTIICEISIVDIRYILHEGTRQLWRVSMLWRHIAARVTRCAGGERGYHGYCSKQKHQHS
jgi:hypothetical protein